MRCQQEAQSVSELAVTSQKRGLGVAVDTSVKTSLQGVAALRKVKSHPLNAQERDGK